MMKLENLQVKKLKFKHQNSAQYKKLPLKKPTENLVNISVPEPGRRTAYLMYTRLMYETVVATTLKVVSSFTVVVERDKAAAAYEDGGEEAAAGEDRDGEAGEDEDEVIRSSKDFSSSGSEADGEDDDMEDSDKDANKDADWAEGDKKANSSPIIQSEKEKTNKECVKNDVEGSATINESIKVIDQEHASNKATVDRQSMADTTINVVKEGKHQSLEPKSANSTSPNGADDGFNEVNSNSTHGLDSLVLDSQSPSKGESQEFGVPKNRDQSAGVQEVEKAELVGHQQVLGRNNVNINSPIVIDSNCSFRPSQLKSINLLVELNPSIIRKTTRSQQYEECMSKEDSVHGSSGDDMTDQDQNREGEVDTFEDTIAAGEILGIDFEESDVWAIKKTFEAEDKETKMLMKIYLDAAGSISFSWHLLGHVLL
ncbi:hypothetical protein RHGRI_013590 [Rhododendron griersonianum]|uniref:Uncharacterized protein n=1 Tax=Rhododendron griersonianum TaxID=479676 RepID=A0AAV6K6H8_9ERIC|nr:hypothetical protein RHGRI_013590 [Rhododendron griersonianum]